ncbi:spore coat protein [Aquibacillus kalidii]|uniref:spore coat protein n=1 Tax=Aquibacillus kalidii TaxID=2762597 RepID=UPI001648DD3E|nr:spore coat protein [Aquibacillus kalidii]
MVLPIIDVGLMNEHLTAHQGIIYRFRNYEKLVKDPFLQKVLAEHIIVLQDHVRVMLELLEPDQTGWVALATGNPDVDPGLISDQHAGDTNVKALVTDLMSTSKHMAKSNYGSALEMANPNVKHVHFQMAMQEASFQNHYAHFMKHKGWAFAPKSSAEVQLKTIEKYIG